MRIQVRRAAVQVWSKALFAATSVLLGSQGAAYAQDVPENWPSQSIRLVVPQGTGGGVDSVARVLAQALAAELKQPVVVENRPGASGNIGAEAVARAKPDGYTWLMGINSQFTTISHLFPAAGFDAAKDLTAVAQTTVGGGYVLAVTNSLPVHTVAELVDYAKKNPDKLSFGSYGIGSAHHLGSELLMHRAGIKMTHVPYKKTPSVDLIAGHIQVLFDSQASMRTLLENNSVRAIAVTASKRVPSMPDLPTLSESYPGMDIVGWHGVWVPTGTPRGIIDRINGAIVTVLKQPEMQKRLADLTYQTTGTTPEETDAMIRKESAAWKELIDTVGIKIQ